MARNGSGTYSLPSGNPVANGTTITDTWANTTLTDIGTALTDSIAKDGQTTPTANLPMGGFKHTNVADGTTRSDYTSYGQVQDGALTYLTSVAGTNTITGNAPASMSSYTAGQFFRFVSVGANTDAATLNINSIGTRSIKKDGSTALAAGDIASGQACEVMYDGTNFQLIGATSLSGIEEITGLTNANVTLTADQYSRPIITLAGTLTGNIQIIFPTTAQSWLVINNTTGGFTVTAKTAAGTGVVLVGGANSVYGDGVNIYASSLTIDKGDLRYAFSNADGSGLIWGGTLLSDGTAVLTDSDSGKWFLAQNGAPITVPSTQGFHCMIVLNGTSGVTFSRADVGQIFDESGASSTSLQVRGGVGGVSKAFVYNVSTTYSTVNSTGRVVISNGLLANEAVALGQFPSSLAASGYKKYADVNSPSGFTIEQWGTATSSGSTAPNISATFPISFPNACVSVILIAEVQNWCDIASKSTTGFTGNTHSGTGAIANGTPVVYRAYGY